MSKLHVSRKRKFLTLASAALAVILGSRAHAGVTVLGGLTNFDTPNDTGTPENEFEIELRDVSIPQIYGYWGNTPLYKGSGYGQPTATVRASSDGIAGHTSTYVDYIKAGIVSPVGFTEHFGVHFNNSFLSPVTVYNWKNNGVTSATTISIPTVVVTSFPNPVGGTTITPVVINTTPVPIIVEFRADSSRPLAPGGLVLGDLVDTNPEVTRVENQRRRGHNGLTGAKLNPGQVLGVDGEGHDPTDPIITNPAAFLAANPLERGFAVDVNTAGDSVLTTLSVFSVGANNTRGPLVANLLSAVNTTSVPEPHAGLLAAAAMVGLSARTRRRASQPQTA